jgi:UDP-N-acetylmuramoylalanine--D-glutamate ligase
MEKIMELKGKRVLVFGTGISGIGSADLLEKAGAVPVLYDGNADRREEDIRAKLPEGSSAQIVIGEMSDELIGSIDLAVLSPGVPTDQKGVLRIRKAEVPIWGEVELA